MSIKRNSIQIIKANAFTGIARNIVIAATGLFLTRALVSNYTNGDSYNAIMSIITTIMAFAFIYEMSVSLQSSKDMYLSIEARKEKVTLQTYNNLKYTLRHRGVISLLLSIIIAIPFSIFTKVELGALELFIVIFLIMVRWLFSVMVLSPMITLVNAYKKSYIVNYTALIANLLVYVPVIIIMQMKVNMLIVLLFLSTSQLVHYLVLKYRFVRVEKLFKNKADAKPQIIKADRGTILARFTWIIVDSTDMVILGLISASIAVSQYAIYDHMRDVAKLMFIPIVASITHIFASKINHKKLSNDEFDSGFLMTTIIGLGVSIVFIFVSASFVSDFYGDRHYNELAGYLFGLIILKNIIHMQSENMIAATVTYGRVTRHAYFEAISNIVLSFVFAYTFLSDNKVAAVLLATTATGFVRVMLDHIFVVKNIVGSKKSIFNSILVMGLGILAIIICRVETDVFKLHIFALGVNWTQTIDAIFIGTMVAITLTGVYITFNWKTFKNVLRIILGMNKKE